MRKLGENIVHDPARKQALRREPKAVAGPGSLASWTQWLKQKPDLAKRLRKRVNTKYDRK